MPPCDPQGKSWKAKTLLSSTVRDRVRLWEGLVRTQFQLDPEDVTTAFMNTTQNPERCPVAVLCPALITKSQLWSFRHQRYLLLQELAEVQGLAVVTKRSRYPCPFREEIIQADLQSEGSIPDGHMRRMIGNGMSMHCIGSVMLYALCFSVPVRARARPGMQLIGELPECPSELSAANQSSHASVGELSAKRRRV